MWKFYVITDAIGSAHLGFFSPLRTLKITNFPCFADECGEISPLSAKFPS